MAADQEALIAATREHLPGVEVTVVEQKAPHHVPEDSELVRCLLAAYHEETGLPAKALSTGGGTYARRCSSRAWPLGQPSRMMRTWPTRQGNIASVSGLMKSAKILANALLRLAGDVNGEGCLSVSAPLRLSKSPPQASEGAAALGFPLGIRRGGVLILLAKSVPYIFGRSPVDRNCFLAKATLQHRKVAF